MTQTNYYNFLFDLLSPRFSWSSSLPMYLEIQHPSQYIILILSQNMPIPAYPFALANLSTISCKPNIPISSFMFFLFINLTLQKD